jgi:acetyl-CoA acetyltransferase
MTPFAEHFSLGIKDLLPMAFAECAASVDKGLDVADIQAAWFESPATREHMAMVAVKNHHHAISNPKAQLRFDITVEQVLNAPIVVEPFGLYDCTPQSDGAAALLLAAADVADRYTNRPVRIRGVGLGLDRVMHHGHPAEDQPHAGGPGRRAGEPGRHRAGGAEAVAERDGHPRPDEVGEPSYSGGHGALR